MAEKLGEVGNLLSGISKAVKTMKSLRDEKSELFRVIEETKKRAGEVEALHLPNEPLLEELKQELREVSGSGSELENWLKTYENEIDELDKFLSEKIIGYSIPREEIKDLCERLTKAHNMATDFSKAFSTFIGHLLKTQELATQIADGLRQRADGEDKQANSTRNWGAAKTAGFAIAGVGAGAGIAALIFFTGGIAFLPLAVLFGGAAVAAGGIMAGETYIEAVMDVNAMRRQASGIQDNSNQLAAIAKNLKSVYDKTGSIKLDKEAMEALQTALAFVKSDVEREDLIAKQQRQINADKAEIDAKNAELAALKDKMRMHGIE